MRRILARLSTLVALWGAGLATACAPSPFVPCNSDDDCTRRELCIDGLCGDAGETTRAPPVVERGRAARGELIVDAPAGGDVTAPSPEPAPEEPPSPPDAPLDPVDDWIDPAFAHRAVVTIAGVPGVLQDWVDDVPVLVRVRAADVGAEVVDGARQRALFTSVEGQPLAAELDSDRGSELVFWVRHSFDPRAELPAPERLYLYAGGDADVSAPAARDAWSAYFAVYHLDAARTLPQPDSTGARAGINEDAEAETVPCAVGRCLFFDGLDDRLVVPRSFPELAGATQATISATVRMTSPEDSFIAVWSTPDANRSRFYLGTDGDGVPQAAVRVDDLTPVVHVAQGGPALTAGVDHQLDAVLDMAAGTVSLFVDGALRATDQFVSLGALPPSASAAAAVGAASGAAAVDEFDGLVDEVRISGRARSADYVKVDAASRAGWLTSVALEQ